MLRLAGASLGAVLVGRQTPANAIFEGPATEWYRPEGDDALASTAWSLCNPSPGLRRRGVDVRT